MNLPITSTTENFQELSENQAINSEIATEAKTDSPQDKTDLVQKIKTSLFKQERVRFRKIINQIRQSDNFETLLNNTVAAIQQELQASRVLIYRFDNHQSGRAIAESMASDWIPTLNEVISCNLFGRKQAADYGKKEFTVVGEGTTNQATPYQQKLLDNFQVRSSLALPIIMDRVWGLLVVQQCDRPRQWQEDEINLLERVSAELSLALQPTQPLLKLGKQQNILTKIEQDMQQLMKETLPQIRQSFQADRVLVYGFNPDGRGEVLFESVDSQWKSAAASFDNDCFLTGTNYQPDYVVNDIYDRGFAPCLIEALEALQVKAYIAIPIVSGDQLLGILGIYQNSGTRNWQESEVIQAKKYAAQFSSPLQQLTFIRHSKFQAKQVEKISQQNILTTINQEARQSMQKMLHQIRQLIQGDRVLVYGYNPDGSGEVLAESVDSQWKKAGSSFDRDYQLKQDCQPYYVVDDIYAKGFTRCFIEQLEALEAKAYITIPVRYNEQLLGILSVFQNSGPRNWQKSEVDLMVQYAEQFSAPLQQTAYMRHNQFRLKQNEKFLERERGLTRMLERIRSAQHKENVFQIATQEGRKLMEVDRLAIYRFEPDWSGKFIAESVGAGWSKLIDTILVVQDTYLQETQGGRYKHGECLKVDDIYTIGHQDCHIQLLEQFEARAYMIAPVFAANKKLWGLIAAYQNTGSRKWQQDEVDALRQIGLQVGIAMEQIEYVEELKEKAEKEAVLNLISDKIRSSSNIDDIFKTTTQELRQILNSDRAVIYQFNPDWSGQVVAESVGAGWGSLLIEQTNDEVLTGNRTGSDRCLLRKWSTGDITTTDSYLQQEGGRRYLQGQKFTAIDNIYNHNFPACYVESLEKYQAKAYVIAPIFKQEKLWGLVGVYQNADFRSWQESETNLITKITSQLGLALQQTELIANIQKRNQELASISERESAIINFSSQLVNRLAGLSREGFDTPSLLESMTKELRQVLKADRVVIYRFNPDWSGDFIVESVGEKWGKLVGTELAKIENTYFQENKGGRYGKKETLVVNDISKADRKDCYLELSEKFETKACIIAPVFLENQLWGLLRVYQNDTPRNWTDSERAVIEQVGTQIGTILQLGKYVTQLRSQEQQLTQAADQERAKRQQLQQGALRVLRALQPSFQGDLTVRAPLSEDEIGTIADGYNTTIQSLRELVRQVQISASRVSDTSGSNSHSVSELSNQAQQQVQRLEVALGELQSMVASTEEVNVNAQKVEQAVQEANKTVQNGDLLMEQTVDSILEMRDTVSATAKKIKRLGEASQRISKVVNLIDNFATQTNLLSLNAAIEATRAGEYGKGFAVVADEVRTLAYQSANATTEIERLVEEIQTEISEVTEVMEVSISQVVEGSDLVDKTRQSLSEIVTVTNQISGLVEGITQATKIQNQQSQSLTEAMNDVSNLANKTFASSTQISQSFQELRYTSEELQTSVSQFKVD